MAPHNGALFLPVFYSRGGAASMVWGWKQSPPIQADKRIFCSTRSPEQRKATKKGEGAGPQPGVRLTISPNLPAPQRRCGWGPGIRLGAPGLRLNGEAALIYGGARAPPWRKAGALSLGDGQWATGRVPGCWGPASLCPLLPQTPAAVTNDRGCARGQGLAT